LPSESTNLNVELTGLVDPARSPAKSIGEDPEVGALLDRLLERVGAKPGTLQTRLVRDLLLNAAKLVPDGRSTGELKLITNSVKEMRYAYKVFAKYQQPHKVTIFGSARTPEDHPDYAACVEFSKLMAERGWMSITGAGNGIMKAGHIGPGRAASFGVAIRLPFETTANDVILGDEKLIHFRYFFTRKLMFLSQAEAVALFPGGFGTMDEAFETLTLVQTGKASPLPIVLMEGAGGSYWTGWDQWARRELLSRGWISPDDLCLYHIAQNAQDAADHIHRFYRVYHSSRYVRDDFVIRLQRPIPDAHLKALNSEFKPLVKTGEMTIRSPYPDEDDHLELPRLAFHSSRSRFGLLRKLIDRINDAPEA
jgi:uncharacterized protein (TIGR00730 family)